MGFSYEWKKTLNAGSREYSDKDSIEINEGSIQKIYAFFYTIMARGKILGREKEEHHIIHMNLISHNSIKEDIVVPIFFCGSADRNNIAEYMARFAIEFLIGHEIGHAYNGHTKYYSSIIKQLSKEMYRDEKERLILDLQTLEMDADAYGINRVLEQAVGLIENSDKIIQILKQKESIFELVCYAVHGLFYILREEHGYNDIEKYKEKLHPPKFVRECLIYGSLNKHLKFINTKNNTKYLYNFMGNHIGSIEHNICDAMEYNNAEYIQFIKENSQVMQEHVIKIEKNWEKVAQIIKQESRLPIEGIDYNWNP